VGRCVRHVAECGHFTVPAERPEVQLFVLDTLTRSFDSQSNLDRRADLVSSGEERPGFEPG
jgi:hypothetical protein